MRKKIFAVITSIIIITFYSCSVTNPIDPNKLGTISGSILTSDTSEGVEGALISIIEADSIIASTLSNKSGEFLFGEIETGIIKVKVITPKGFKKDDDLIREIKFEGSKNLNFKAIPIRDINTTIIKGEVATLATASGAFIQIDASNSDQNLSVNIEEIEIEVDTNKDIKPIRVSIRQNEREKQFKNIYGFSNLSSTGIASISVNVWRFLPNDFETVSFSYNVGSEEEPLLLYADTETTTYIDPDTGTEHIVPMHSFDIPSNVDFDAIMNVAQSNNDCSDANLSTLEPIFEQQQGDQPLIFVHGWQPFRTECDDFKDFSPVNGTFKNLIEKLSMHSEVRTKFKFYSYKYPTNAPILVASNDLNNKIESLGLRNPVVIGHSMGGLVARGLMATYGEDKLNGLITLGTPHYGSPLADAIWISDISSNILCPSTPIFCGISILQGEIFPVTNGLRDLAVNSEFIESLNSTENSKKNVYALGGNLLNMSNINFDQLESYTFNPVKRQSIRLASRLMEADGLKHDAIVPLNSAIPSWSLLQTELSKHSHFNIHSTDEVVSNIVPTLSVLSECGNPPDKPGINDFNVSGSIAREDTRTIRVTLNSISIDGSIVSNLSQDNFIVVENDCVRPIKNFSTENVGVDIVFIQDLSSSMNAAISGVRSSVISFASELENSGINAKFASVGYSGSGTIPSTPSTSDCEFLGPFKNLDDATSFQLHVSDDWRAMDGCDGPENGLEAIEYAHENISWREGAARVYIDITDISHHSNETNCNGHGSCSDQSLDSITELVGESSIIHVIAPSSESQRTFNGGLDPWKLADATGGQKLVLPSDGYVDLTDLGIANIVGEAITFTFESASPQKAIHSLRIRAEIEGKIAEIAPNLVRYKPINGDLAIN